MAKTEYPNGTPEPGKTPGSVVNQVAEGLRQAGISPDRMIESVQKAVQKVDQAVNSISQEIHNAAGTFGQKTAQTGAPRYPSGTPYAAQTPGQNPRQPQPGYRYAPPVPPVRASAAAQARAEKSRVHAVPPPGANAPKMKMVRKPSNFKFWFVGIICMAYALTLPLYHWTHLAAFAAVAVGVYFLGANLLFRGKKTFVPVEPETSKAPAQPKAPEKRASTGNAEVDRIIDEGHAYLQKLRDANDRIPDAVMSERISRMENASADIFAYITEHPDQAPQIRRFMNYYLPTTLKLLTSYETLSRQRVKGETVRNTMFEIEGIMETIASAFEKQLDSLFGSDAMDIAADISVMESILKQEGLAQDDSLNGSAAKPEVPAPGGNPGASDQK